MHAHCGEASVSQNQCTRPMLVPGEEMISELGGGVAEKNPRTVFVLAQVVAKRTTRCSRNFSRQIE